jgi:hypothetical protein
MKGSSCKKEGFCVLPHIQERLRPGLPVSKEGDIPRICVSSKVFFCIRAIVGGSKVGVSDVFAEFKSKDKGTGKQVLVGVAVYGTEEQPYLPPDASDFRRNSEHWFLKPVRFERLGFLCFRSLLLENKVALSEKPLACSLEELLESGAYENRALKVRECLL